MKGKDNVAEAPTKSNIAVRSLLESAVNTRRHAL